MIIIDALAKSSSALGTAWSEVHWKLPLVCSKSTVGWNFPVGGTYFMSAFVTPVARLVLGVVGHHEGELVLVVVLDTFFITIL